MEEKEEEIDIEKCETVSQGVQTDEIKISSDEKLGRKTMIELDRIVQGEGLVGFLGKEGFDLVMKIEKNMFEKFTQIKSGELPPFQLGDVCSELTKCAKLLVKDDFSDCFKPNYYRPWNKNVIYFVLWLFGILIRYLLLLPLRFIFLLLTTILLITSLLLLRVIFGANSPKITKPLNFIIKCYTGCWLFSIGGVFRIDGNFPHRRKNQIFVCNHTSFLDVAFLLRIFQCCFIGQAVHGGMFSFLQNYVLYPMKNIWFERMERHDRIMVKKRIYDHIHDPTNPALLVFPEGVCVNNRYTVMFRKGVFEMEDVEICPIAMKYNMRFGDGFWRNNETFFMYILRLMKEWCTYVEIHFLESEKRLEDETAIEFADRVKSLISEKIGLRSVQWDGYLKYFQPGVRWKTAKQKQYATKVLKKLKIHHAGTSQ